MSNLISQQKQPQTLQLKEISIIPITTPIPQTVGQTHIAPSSSITITGNNNQAADEGRKKRCTDRCDSSESSDRLVETFFFFCILNRRVRLRKTGQIRFFVSIES